LEQLTGAKKAVPTQPQPELPSSAPAAQPKNPLKRSDSRGEYTQSPVKKLDAIMKTELLADKSDEEIKLVCNLYIKFLKYIFLVNFYYF